MKNKIAVGNWVRWKVDNDFGIIYAKVKDKFYVTWYTKEGKHNVAYSKEDTEYEDTNFIFLGKLDSTTMEILYGIRV